MEKNEDQNSNENPPLDQTISNQTEETETVETTVTVTTTVTNSEDQNTEQEGDLSFSEKEIKIGQISNSEDVSIQDDEVYQSDANHTEDNSKPREATE